MPRAVATANDVRTRRTAVKSSECGGWSRGGLRSEGDPPTVPSEGRSGMGVAESAGVVMSELPAFSGTDASVGVACVAGMVVSEPGAFPAAGTAALVFGGELRAFPLTGWGIEVAEVAGVVLCELAAFTGWGAQVASVTREVTSLPFSTASIRLARERRDTVMSFWSRRRGASMLSMAVGRQSSSSVEAGGGRGGGGAKGAGAGSGVLSMWFAGLWTEVCNPLVTSTSGSSKRSPTISGGLALRAGVEVSWDGGWDACSDPKVGVTVEISDG